MPALLLQAQRPARVSGMFEEWQIWLGPRELGSSGWEGGADAREAAAQLCDAACVACGECAQGVPFLAGAVHQEEQGVRWSMVF